MKVVSLVLLWAYWAVSAIALFLLFSNYFYDWEPIPSNPWFSIVLPLMVFLGIIGGMHSRKLVFIKLTPWITALLLYIGSLFFFSGETNFITMMGVIGIVVLGTVQFCFSALVTGLYGKSI